MAYVNLAKGLGAARSRNRVVSDLYPRRPWRRGVAGFGGRGLGRLSFPQVMVPVPQPAPFPPTSMPTAETEVANAAAQLANDPTVTAVDYPTRAAITASLIAFAQTRCNNSWAPYTCAGGFDPVAIGTKYANLAWAALQSDISPVSGKPNYNPLPGAAPPPSTPPVYQAPYDPTKVAGSSALPPPPASYVPPPAQPVAGAATPAGIVSGDGSGFSWSSSSTEGLAAAPNWPLIAGGAALLLGGLYFLGGSK